MDCNALLVIKKCDVVFLKPLFKIKYVFFGVKIVMFCRKKSSSDSIKYQMFNPVLLNQNIFMCLVSQK